ncbi:MAG: hypothetical protein IKU23_06515 [Clostridia bacterium]|nr:hypothetical protein [Clostridia bacterium]MBR5278901.1 hypothetical protein [Clostridia bacterium]
MKKSVFILLCLALTLFAAGCVDDKKPDDHNSEQSTSDNLINSLPDISLPDKEQGEIDGSGDAKHGGWVDGKGRTAYDERYNDGYDGNFGGVQNGVTDGGIMDGGIPGSPDYMP